MDAANLVYLVPAAAAAVFAVQVMRADKRHAQEASEHSAAGFQDMLYDWQSAKQDQQDKRQELAHAALEEEVELVRKAAATTSDPTSSESQKDALAFVPPEPLKARSHGAKTIPAKTIAIGKKAPRTHRGKRSSEFTQDAASLKKAGNGDN